MDRKKLISNLKKFKKKIEKKYGVKKIILFGSQVSEKSNKESDVDIIVVGKFKEKYNRHRSPPLYLEWDMDIPVDFLCYSQKEFEKLSKKITLVREAVQHGIIIE